MRRGAGLAGLRQQQQFQQRARALGEELTSQKLAEFRQHYENFQQKLHSFASQHRKRINSDPQFRYRFWQMCSELNVDPLSSTKGVWDQLGMGDFYYGLAVQISHICLATREINGGFLCLEDLRSHLNRRRRAGSENSVSDDDIERAIKSLRVLDSGFELVKLNNKTLIRSVPEDLSQDETSVLKAVGNNGKFTHNFVIDALGWNSDRTFRAINDLQKMGLVWVDLQDEEPEYWILSFLSNLSLSE
ncbi:hypothetical protein P9112_008034 [Eukaryota sp. TZLM1-RC]